MSGLSIQRGDLVEFTRDYHQHYPPAPAHADQPQFGVCVESVRNFRGAVKVMLADRSVVTARHVHAVGWAGWMPDELQDVYDQIQFGESPDYRRGHEISRDCPCDRCDAWFRTHDDAESD